MAQIATISLPGRRVPPTVHVKWGNTDIAMGSGHPIVVQSMANTPTADVEQTVAQVLRDNPAAVADYQGGNQKVAGFLVGQAMRQLKGKADPAGVKACVEKALCQIHESNI